MPSKKKKKRTRREQEPKPARVQHVDERRGRYERRGGRR